MTSTMRGLIIGVALAGACALAAVAAAPPDSHVRDLTAGSNDPPGVVIDSIIVNILNT